MLSPKFYLTEEQNLHLFLALSSNEDKKLEELFESLSLHPIAMTLTCIDDSL